MMATVHPTTSGLVPLLESLEDAAVGQVEQTDAYLTIANRLSGDDGKHFVPAVVKHFSRLGKVFQTHIVSPNVELSQAALQALGFCVFHSSIVSGIPAAFVEEILVALNGVVIKSTDKNTCTRALWVISKQNFPSDLVARKVPDILKTLEAVRAREDLQSVIMEHEALNVVIRYELTLEHEALNVVIRLLEQTPSQMGEGAVRWAKVVIPLVVHSASKVRLRAAAALEIGLPLLLQKQQEVAAVIEPLMSSKLIPELQKLFSSKNESNVLKLWPLFVKLLGKILHRGGPFINSLLHLEELGFRSSSPIIKKIAFIAWKSLIDNFALNPDILCSAKRLKLLMQPLSSIQVRTEALLLTKLEVWWYLVVRLGPNLAVNFEQVAVPLLQIAVSSESQHLSVNTPSRNSSQNTTLTSPKSAGHSFNSSSSTPRMILNSSATVQPTYPSIQLLGLEMLLHYFLGSEVTTATAKSKLQLSLEPLTHPLLTSPSSFTKHAAVLISAVRDSFIGIGKDAPEPLLMLIWKSLIGFVTAAMETAGSKKDRPGSEVLTLLLQALESIISSEALPAQRILGLLEATVKGIPRKILGSAAYQVANMDVLNGTPALFLILLLHRSSVLASCVSDERFFLCLETLIGCGLSGPASPLAFSESVLGVMSRNAEAIQNEEHLWRMWSIVVNPLTDTISQTNEVNQGDALEHNFTALHRALMFPVTHLLVGHTLSPMTQKSLLSTWSRLYKAFARCSALVATAEENVCCEELCGKMSAVLDAKVLSNPSTLEAVASLLLIVIESVDFSPYTPHYQKTKSPHTPLGWVRKKNKALGNLTTFQALLVQALQSFLSQDSAETGAGSSAAPSGGQGLVLVSILSTLFSNLVLGTAVLAALAALSAPLAQLYEHAGRPQNEQPKFFTCLGPKLEKLLGEILGCLQSRAALAYDDELLALLTPLLRVLFPHRSKQLRTLVTQFWNATFANTATLTYPEELKPILSQVKQKTPIILPGFQAVDVPEDLSGPYSGESSQMETHISGVKIASAGKRDSLLSRADELRDKASSTHAKPIAVKLDFGSPKLPRRELLEEEASMDFVFIPPETKERVLTEHQKEVKRTKRVDIPAMYNNLDASLDTTAFTQYTQSQQESMDNQPADEEPEEMSVDEGPAEVEDHIETEEAPEPNQGDVGVTPVADLTGGENAEEERPAPAKKVEPKTNDGSPKQNDLTAEVVTKETEISADVCNVSASSDVVSGTPPKPNSRRQSFITIEKYVEGKPASPIQVTKFTGPLSRTSSSQDTSHSPQNDTSQISTEAPAGLAAAQVLVQHETDGEQQVSSEVQVETFEDKEKEEQPSPRVEEVGKHHPSEGTEDEDDIIPDTQTEASQDEDSFAESMYDSCEDSQLNDSQCSQVSGSQSEIRRSGRRRSRPLRPGEDREEVEGRYKRQQKSLRVEEMRRCDPHKPDLSPAHKTEGLSQNLPGRRNKMPVETQEVDVKEKLRKTRASSQTVSSLMSPSDGQSPGRVTRSRAAAPTEEEVSRTKSETALSAPVSQTDSQGLGRSSRRSKGGGSVEEMSQTNTQLSSSTCVNQTDSQSQGRPSKRTRVSGPAEELSQSDTQAGLSTPVSQTDGQSQGRLSRRNKASDPPEHMGQTDTLAGLSTPVSQTDSQSQGRPGRRSKASDSSEEVNHTDIQKTLSAPVTQTDSQSQGRPGRRSKASDPSEEMSQNDTQNSLTTPVSQTDGQSMGRTGRPRRSSAISEEMSQNDTQNSLATPVGRTDSPSKGRPGRPRKSSAISEEMSHDVQTSLSKPVSQTDSQSHSRVSTRSKASASSEVMSQTDVQTSLSTPVSQTDSQSQGRRGRRSKVSGPTEELSQTDTQASLSTPVSQTDSQSQGRPSRRSKASDHSEEFSQTDTQKGSSAPLSQNNNQLQGRSTRNSRSADPSQDASQIDLHPALASPTSQTDSQSQSTPSKRSQTAAQLNVSISLRPTSVIDSECSPITVKDECAQESSQNLGQAGGLSQGFLSGNENSDLDLSEACEDGKKSLGKGRKRKLLNSEAKPQSLLETHQVADDSEQMGTIETTSEVEMVKCGLSQNSESESIPTDTKAEAVEPSEEKENKNFAEIMVPVNPSVELRAALKSTSETLANVTSEMQEKLSKPSVDPSIGLAVNNARVEPRRGRGRRRSRGSNYKAVEVGERPSQGGMISSSQSAGSQDVGEIAVSQNPNVPLSDSNTMSPQLENASPQQEDVSKDNDVFFEVNATSTPTFSECLLATCPEETKETTWSTSESWITAEGQSVTEASEQAMEEDLEDGQQQDIDVPRVADVTEKITDPAKEQDKKNVIRDGEINQEEALISTPEQNTSTEVAVEEAKEVGVPQMDSDIPVAAGDTAVQALLAEPPAPRQVMEEPLCLDSPLKQKHLDTVAGEVGQSPSSGKTKGVWSPSASPSTSILKKGQKRPLEVESPSPLQKSRRVSFADPIHHQELADDIDRRSPVIRQASGSSPRSKNVGAISSQQKFVTTPTKGLLSLSPRNLRSPGFKSSKKCLISEMSQEPKPIPKDCVYPALVSCSTPVEAVLPQITSNMWPRGFGQLVRARNIRTVGDLSALTPSEIKSLPIRSPKLSNVKKALKNYHEQQRKGRSDELKGFDEMEKMTSEADEVEVAPQPEEGQGQPTGEPATDAELVEVLAPPPMEHRPAEQNPMEPVPVVLLSAVEALGARLTPQELGQCSAGQLVLIHEQLGGMMRSIVLHLQARLAPSAGESLP